MNILAIRKIYFIFPMKQICPLIRQIVYLYFCIIYFWQVEYFTISFTLHYLFFYNLYCFLYLHSIHSLGIVVKCFHSERSSGQSLQFLRPTHLNFNFISVSGRFGRILCLFFMAWIQFPHKSFALTASFTSGSRQTRPLFYPVRQLDHVCRVDAEEDIQDFRPLRPGPDPPEIVVLFLCPISITLSISLLSNYWAFPDSP